MKDEKIITAPTINKDFPCEGCIFNGDICGATSRQTIDCNELDIIYIKKQDDEPTEL